MSYALLEECLCPRFEKAAGPCGLGYCAIHTKLCKLKFPMMLGGWKSRNLSQPHARLAMDLVLVCGMYRLAQREKLSCIHLEHKSQSFLSNLSRVIRVSTIGSGTDAACNLSMLTAVWPAC